MRALLIILNVLLLTTPIFGFVPPSFVTTTVPNGEYNSPYSVNIIASDDDGDPIMLVLTPGGLPAGLNFIDNSDGTGTVSGTPTETGMFSFEITATANGESVPQSFDLTINKAAATVAISNTTQTYDTNPKPVTTVTTPAGLAVDVTYAGSPTPPTNAGTYAIVATINDANYEGSTTGSLTINKAAATVAISNTTQTYDTNPKPVTTVTTPAGLAVDVTYAGSPTPPTNAGTYAIVATINDANYQGSNTGSLTINKAAATVAISNTTQTYDTNPKPVTTVTTPAGLAVDVTYAGSPTPPTNAGTYAIVATINDANYEGSNTGSLTINKAAATVAISNTTQTYDTNPKPVTTVTTPAGLAVDVTYAGSPTPPTNAGTYAIVATINDANYEGSNTGSLTINKAAATVAISNTTQTYNTTPRSVTTLTDPAGLAVDVTYAGSPTPPTNAGTYAIVATINDANYEGSNTGSLTINKAAATVAISNTTQTYDTNPKPVTTVTTPAGLAVDVTYAGSPTPPTNAGTYAIVATINDANYEGSNTGSLTINKAAATVAISNTTQTYNTTPRSVTTVTTPAGLAVDVTYAGSPTPPTNAGTYAIVATINDANYEGSNTGSLTINKAAATVAISNTTQTYDTNPKPVTTVTTPAGLAVDVTYAGSPTPPTNAGTYAIVATINDANYEGSNTGSLTINKAAATVAISNTTQTYNSTPRSVTTVTTPAGLAVDVTYAGSPTPPTNAGTYAIVTTINDANYEGSNTGSLTINKAAATVAISNTTQTYNTTPRSVTTVTTPAGLAVDVTYAGSPTPPTNAGTYAIVATINDANYEGSNTGSLTINKAAATVAISNTTQTYDTNPKPVTTVTTPAGLAVDVTYAGSPTPPTNAGTYAIVDTINDANYEGSNTGSLTINKAAATVAISNTTQTYNSTPRSVTTVTTPAGLAVDVTYAGSPTPPTNAGTYAIVTTINDANYEGSNTGSLTINKAAATVAISNTTQTYNTTPRSVTTLTDPAGLAVDVTYAGSPTPPTNAGTYAIVATINDANYEGSNTGSLTINKAAATVAISNTTQTYDTNPKPVTTVTTPAGLAVDVTYAGSPTPPTNAGTYAIVATINDANYEGSNTGSLTINKAAATVAISNTTQTYDTNPKPVTTVTTPAGLTVDVTYAGSPTPPTNAGTYAIVATINDANYEGSNTGSLTINKAIATVNISNNSFTYDGSPKTATAVTIPTGLFVNFGYDGDFVNDPEDAGIYAVEGIIQDSNYQGSGTGTLTINKAQGIITITNLYQNFNGTPKAVTTSTNPSGLTVDVLYNGFAAVPSAVGSYVIEATIDDNNYEGQKNETLIINGAPSTSGLVNVNVNEDADNVYFNLYNAFSDLEDADSELIYSIQGNTNPTLFSAVVISGSSLIIDFAANQFGSATITVRATDQGGLFVNTSSTITVAAVQDDPEFTSSAITGAVQDQLYTYNVTTSDADPSDDLTITSLIALPAWLNLLDNGDGTAVLSGTPANSDAGQTFGIALSVSDDKGNDENQFFNILVSNSNDAPFFTSTPITTATQDIEYTYFINSDDDDSGDVLSLSAPTLPDWLSLVDNGDGSGSISGTPDNTDTGTNAVLLRVTDNSGAAEDQSFNINVGNANDAPFFTSTPIVNATEDALYTYNISVDDDDIGDELEITVLSKPSWLTLTDNGNGTATLTGTPLNQNVGSSSVVLNVRDQDGASVNQNFSITVTNTNDAPQFTSTPVTVAIQDAVYTYNVQATDPDVGDVLTLTATQKPSWLTFTDNGSGTATLTGTPTNADLGSNSVTLRVVDNSGAAINQVFTINVDNQNDPPSFTSTPVQSVNEDAVYTYNITTTDPDAGDTRTIIALSLPGWLGLSDNGNGTAVLAGTPLNQHVGNSSVVLNVRDALGANVNQNFTISVANTNDAPVFLTAPITSAVQDIAYSYNVNTDDPDLGDQVSLSVEILPSWLTFTNNGDGSGRISGTPTNANLGANQVRFVATDNSGATITQVFSINVDNQNDAPSFTSTPLTSVSENSLYEYLIETTDPDNGDVLEIRAVVLPGWLGLTDNGDGTGLLSGTPLNSNVGLSDVVIAVEDAQGVSVNQNFTITVINTNDPPVFVSQPITGAIQDQAYTYNITTSDPDNGDTRSIASVTLPSWLALTDNGNGTASLTGIPTNANLGSNPVVIRVTDVEGAATEQSFTINVDNQNDPPSFTSTPITSVDEDQAYSYFISTSDPDVGDTRDIISLSKPSWLTLTDNGDGTALLTGTPLNANVGNATIVLNVSDAVGANVNQNFTIQVRNTNDPPFFTTTPVPIAVQDAAYGYNIGTGDPDIGDTRVLTATTLPAWLTFTQGVNGAGTLTGTPTNANLGQHQVVLNIEDASGTAVDQVFTINVDNANDPPSFVSTPITTINEDQLYTYNISATDPDVGDIQVITALSKPTWLTLTDNGDGTAVLAGTPLNQHVGSIGVVLNVRDGIGANVNQSFTIQVNNTNDAPVFSSTPVTGAIQDAVYTYNVQATDPDVGDVLMLTATQKPSWLTFTDNGSGTATLTGTPTNADLGSNSVTLRVVDNSGAAINQVFTINVDNQNDPPSFTSTPVQSVNEDAVYTYNITTTDPDAGDTRTIIALSLPGWLGLSDNGNGTAVLAGTPLNQHVGNSSVVLNVRDALGANVNQNFTISVANTNDAPVFLTAPITSAVQDIAYSYNVNTDDPDLGDQVSLSVEILPSWLTFTNNGDGSGRISGTPTNANLGANQVRFVATDNSGATITQVFSINVDNQNDAPSFTSTPLTSVSENSLYEYLIETTDPDNGDVLEIRAVVLPGWLGLTDNGDGTGLLSGTPLNSNVGLSDVVIAVEDAQGVSVNQNFTITVINTNDPPVFVSQPITGAIQDQAYTYNITTSDPDNGDTRSIASVTLPSWLALTDNGNGTASLTGIPTNANLGSNPVVIRVTDVEGAATEQSFTINVDNQNDPPSFTSTPITSVDEDQAYSYFISTSDPDVGDTRDIISLSKPSWLTLTDNGDGTALLTGTPLNANVGNATIVLNVSDAVGANVNQNFTIQVRNTNDPPFFTTTPVPIAVQDAAYGYNIGTGDPDIGDTRVLTATTLPAWLTFTQGVNGAGTLTGTPTNANLGQHQVVLNIEDASGTAVDQVFTINVDNANDPPSFVSTPITTINEDQLYTYNISATDPDVGDIQVITALSKPTWLTLTDNGDGTAVLAGTPLNQHVGSIGVVLNVRDGIGANVNQSFTIQVNNTNDAPVFSSTPVTGAIQDAVYTYNVQATDPDVGDVLMLTATQKPSWLTFTDNGSGTATLTGTPTNADLGSNSVTLRVVDNSGAAINQVFTINVDNQNDPPSFTSTPVQSVNEDAVYTYNITTTDPDAGDTRTIIALSLPGWLGLTDNGDGTAVLTGTPLNQHVGNLNLVIEVQDGLGVKATQSFTVAIFNTNDVPAFSTSPVTGAIQDVVYTYSVQAIDPDIGDIVTLTATQKPNWLTFTDNGSGTATLTGTPTNADLGSNSVILRVVDNSGAAINQVFTINVDNQNDPPSFTSTPVQSVNEDALYAYNITTTDPDIGDTRSITALSLPEWLSLTDNGDGNAILTGTPLNQHVGSLNLVLEVEDGVGVKVTQSFTVTIFNTNDVPAFSTSPVLTVQQGNLYEYQVATSDPDLGDSRVLTTGALPSWLDFTDNGDGSGLLFGTPANQDLGEYAIILTVEDDSGAAVDQVFEISVTNLNDPPIFTSTPIILIDEDALYEYNITTTDPDTGDVLSITALSKPAWLTLVDNADGTGLLSGTPLNSNVGANEVVLNITDDNGANSNQIFTIQVINTNDAPSIISSPFLTAQQDLLYTYNIQIQDPDIGDTFVFEGQGIPTWLTLTDNGNGTAKLSGTPVELDQGTYNIEVKVIDNAGAEDVQSFELLVNNENDPPVFESAPIISVNEDENYSYQITTSDPDVGDILNIVIIDKPSWLTFVENDDNTAQLSGVPTNNNVGVHNIKLRVTDVAGQTVQQNFELTVLNTNDLPVFTSEPILNATEDQPYEYLITAIDVDAGATLTIEIENLPEWLDFEDNGNGTGILLGTPENVHVGEFPIRILLSDGQGAPVLQEFELIVNNVNDNPVLTSEPITSVLEDDIYEYLIVVNDPDVGDDYTVSSTSLPSWLALSTDDSGSTLLSGTPLNEHVGVVKISLEVEDLAGAIDEQIFNLEVVNTNDNPIFTSEPVAKVGIEEVFLYDVTVVDPDLNDRVTIVANKIPPYLTFVDNGNGTARVQGTVPQNAAESKDIILEATDLNGGKTLQEFSLDVNNPPTLNNFEVSTDEDVDYQFSLVDFESNFNDDPGDELGFIRVISLPSNGQLLFNGEAIDLSSDISANQIAGLAYRPNLNYFGDDNFEWKASDGTSISSQVAEVSIFVEAKNDAPQLITGRQGDVLDALEYSPGDPGLNILRGGEVTVRDNDDGDLIEGAQVSISTNFNSGDQLTLELEAQDVFQSTYNAQNGILTITGSASATAYSDVLEKVKFASSVSSSIELLDKQLQIVVVDEEDESNIVSRVIKITEVFPELDIVNAFTPNGDGVNDVWDILNLQFYSDISINVYDADGSKVFSCSDQNCQWDGTNKGRGLPFGPYFYAIDLNDGKRKYTGTVTILK